MSEEQPSKAEEAPVEKVEPMAEVAPEPVWSAPLEPVTPEMGPMDLEPLQPIAPKLAEAVSTAILPPLDQGATYPGLEEALGEYEQTLEDAPRPLMRPVAPITTETCPEGFIGLCVNCQKLPCSYILGRVFRYLLTKVEYGEGI